MQLTIEKLIYGGDGLARLPADDHGRGKAVFIPFILEGEKVEASLVEQKKGFARGRADLIMQPSAHRVAPPCQYFKRCGGCNYQHSDYSHQLEIKAAILRENLRRIAKLELDVELQTHPSPPWGYRNRSRFSVQFEPHFALCYHKLNSHQLLPVEQCPISSPLINRALERTLHLGRAGDLPPGIREIEFFADADDAALIVEAYCSADVQMSDANIWMQALQHRMTEILGVAVFKTGESNSSQGPGKIEQFASTGETNLTYGTQRASYRVSAGAFFQVNRHLIGELARVVTHGCSGNTALDLYAGVGLFSSVLSLEFHRVIAVESSPASYADLQYNSAASLKAVHSTTEQYLKNVVGKLHPDFVVADPPRAGLNDAVIASLTALDAPRIAYVSCDPATLARDLRGLLDSGYSVENAHLVDLFPQTFHIESVFHLVR
ncbi:MAG: class I SAM-dependent RNA methyltransferase [Terriglobales bacterium]